MTESTEYWMDKKLKVTSLFYLENKNRQNKNQGKIFLY